MAFRSVQPGEQISSNVPKQCLTTDVNGQIVMIDDQCVTDSKKVKPLTLIIISGIGLAAILLLRPKGK